MNLKCKFKRRKNKIFFGDSFYFAGNLKKLLTSDEVHAYFLRESDPKWRVDETKRPDEAPPTQHFRKLTID